MRCIAVFCGSSKGNSGIYAEKAVMLGRFLAEKGIRLVFGGGKVGLMGVLADAAIEAGGSVVGVIPRFLNIKEVVHDGVTELIHVNSMHERKALISEMSDGFIALPGGFGTLDEFFEMLTWGQLGLHRKPVGILNVNGYFSDILKAMDTMVREGFLKGINREMVIVSDRVEELIDKMEIYKAPTVPKWIQR
jgi:uncharacterized protein (TIGR00730 family)